MDSLGLGALPDIDERPETTSRDDAAPASKPRVARGGNQFPFLGSAVAGLVIYTVLYEIFGGPVRYVLIDADALFINNIPSIAAAALFVAYFHSDFLRNERASAFLLVLLGFIGIYGVYGLFNDLSFGVTSFGFYIWAAFLSGALLCVYGRENMVLRWMPVFWACAVAGVLLNTFVTFPWTGMKYVAHGVTMEAGRKAFAFGGYERLAGFGRYCFATSGIILVSYASMLASRNFSRLFILVAFMLSVVAIFLTTAKIDLFLLICLPLVMFGYRHLGWLFRKSRIPFIYAVSVLAVLGFLMVWLPIVADGETFRSISGQYMFLSAASLLDRAANMWPGAFKLLHYCGDNYLLGCGIGGIGIPVAIDDIHPLNTSADNLFVYVLVSCGLLAAVPMIWGLFRNLALVYARSRRKFETLWLLTFCLLGLGITENIVEDPTLVMLLGFLVARGYTPRGFRRKRHSKLVNHGLKATTLPAGTVAP